MSTNNIYNKINKHKQNKHIITQQHINGQACIGVKQSNLKQRKIEFKKTQFIWLEWSDRNVDLDRYGPGRLPEVTHPIKCGPTDSQLATNWGLKGSE